MTANEYQQARDERSSTRRDVSRQREYSQLIERRLRRGRMEHNDKASAPDLIISRLYGAKLETPFEDIYPLARVAPGSPRPDIAHVKLYLRC